MRPYSGTGGHEPGPARRVVRGAAGIALAALVVAWFAYLGRQAPEQRPPETITVYASSALEETMLDSVLPRFQREWEARSGRRLEIVSAFAGSGALVERILREVPVEIAVLASEIDARRLAERGLTSTRTWRRLPHHGVVARSPIVLAVRGAAAAGSVELERLLEADLDVLQADPRSSSAGEWSILALYASLLARGDEPAAALDATARLWARAGSFERSARAARLAFEGGRGDVLVTYEKEALEARRTTGATVVYPRTTVIAEFVVCRIDRNVSAAEAPVVDALIAFLWSDDAQAALARSGFRPAEEPTDPVAAHADGPRRLVTLDQLGGAERIDRELIRPLLRTPTPTASSAALPTDPAR